MFNEVYLHDDIHGLVTISHALFPPFTAQGVEQHAGQQLVLRDPFQSMMFPFGGMSPFGSMFQNMVRMCISNSVVNCTQ